MGQRGVVWVAFCVSQNLQGFSSLALLQQAAQSWVNLSDHLHGWQVLHRHHIFWCNFLDVTDTHDLLTRRAINFLFGACFNVFVLLLGVSI